MNLDRDQNQLNLFFKTLRTQCRVLSMSQGCFLGLLEQQLGSLSFASDSDYPDLD